MPQRSGWARGACTLIVAFLLAGCSAGPEPGLFVREPPDPAPEPPRVARSEPSQDWPQTRSTDRRSNPRLPVVGEQVWTSADGIQLTVRIAVHAVRRIEGATVLDWSITPLRGPGLRRDDVVPSTINLGLHRFDQGNVNVFLVDPGRNELYRPLVRRDIARQCLCTPLWRVQRELRIGRTTLLQVAFPALPAEVSDVDVDVATVPVFAGVPVTPVGQAPTATAPTDLARRPDRAPARRLLGDTAYRGQRFRIEVARLVAHEHVTSLEWVVTSLSAGGGLEEVDGPPFADPTSAIDYNPIAASGPRLVTDELEARARLVASSLATGGGTECVCSDLRIWAKSLRTAGRDATVITNFPPLPASVSVATVRLPGVGEVQVDVTRDADVGRSGPSQVATVGTWRESDAPRGWSAHAWPTSLPASSQLTDFLEVRDRFLR